MKVKYKIILGACFMSTGAAFAQNANDALRYSMQSFGTTARSMSMGGAFGALGADFSSLSSNPAGIAVYRRSEFTFSPVLQFNNANSTYLGSASTNSNANLGVGNIGFVLAFPREKKVSGWKGTSFGFGYNRINSFSNRFSFEGTNTKNSINDYFADLSNGISQNSLANEDQYQFDAGLAFNSYLINPVTNSASVDQYQGTMYNSNLLQKGLITRSGSQGEIDIAFAANYNDKVFLGATLGIPYLRYTTNEVYEEYALQNTLKDSISGKTFKNSKYTQKVSTQGNGINLKLGVIYKPVDMVRLGLAIHTPSFYELNDQYSSTVYANFQEGYLESKSPDGKFSYQLTTPFKAIASVGLVFLSQGIISVDYEYINYSAAHLDTRDSYNFSSENTDIANRFSSASNLKIGGEYRYQIFAFRAGAVLQSSPYDGSLSYKDGNLSALSYTGGIGIKGDNFFVDFGYAFTKTSGNYTPYTLYNGDQPTAAITSKANRFMMTFGVKF
ncbi:MAG: outer membrane protein transport protein [Bacteroidetes bacterium]|jgi:hypothetical protein|nr:outer membrane protein transport protein [Bacteroidota bacterium]